MKKVKLLTLLAVVVGLFAAIPVNASFQAVPGDRSTHGAGDLGLLIVINRLEMTPSQMRQVHGILASVLDEANTLKSSRESFEQEMIRFNGSRDELDALLEAFKEQTKEQAASLQESVEGAIEELKGILTIEQGEILREALTQGQALRQGALGSALRRKDATLFGMQMGRQESSEMLGPQMRERAMEWLGKEDRDLSPEQIREFMANNPQIREQIAERLRNWRRGEGQEGGQPPFGTMGERPMEGARQFITDHPAVGRHLAGEALCKLEQIVDILEMKLQYIE